MSDARADTLLKLTTQIVEAHVANNTVSSEVLLALIRSVYSALARSTPASLETSKPAPAVSPQKSVIQDHIICLEDGKKMKMLKRHLRTRYNMTPEQYRIKWNLPPDYPMVAPAYAKVRSNLAKASGLGRNPGEPTPKRSERTPRTDAR